MLERFQMSQGKRNGLAGLREALDLSPRVAPV